MNYEYAPDVGKLKAYILLTTASLLVSKGMVLVW